MTTCVVCDGPLEGMGTIYTVGRGEYVADDCLVDYIHDNLLTEGDDLGDATAEREAEVLEALAKGWHVVVVAEIVDPDGNVVLIDAMDDDMAVATFQVELLKAVRAMAYVRSHPMKFRKRQI